jgi:hypothetical protein
MTAVLLTLAIWLTFLTTAFSQADFPAAVEMGSPFEATWTGSEREGRFAILSKTEDGYERVSGWKYLSPKSNVHELTAPVKPGDYFIGYEQDGGFTHVKPLTVTPVEASLTAPGSAEINQEITVDFEGPASSGVVIGIYEENEGKITRHAYAYPAQAEGQELTLKTPVESGDYEVRYMMGDVTLAAEPIQVGGAEASLSGPDTVQAGAELPIEWSGPPAAENTIAIVKPGETERIGKYRYVESIEDDTVLLEAPEETGSYEVVYLVRSTVIARHPIEVVEATATLKAPEEVTAFMRFNMEWTGPGNRSDRIDMRAPDDTRASVVYVDKDSNIAEMIAPEPGEYELQYRARGGKILAKRPITVVPPPTKPGELAVVTTTSGGFGENSAVEVILDASGSMLRRQGGERRINIAKQALLGLLGETIPEGTPFALRVFGHKQADSCRTDLEIPLGPLDVAAAGSMVSSIQAMNRAKTPIAASLEKTMADLRGVTGERIIILITDGEETCDGDPLLAIDALKKSGVDVRVNIVGYAIDDEGLRETFRVWATVGDGRYLNAPDADELSQALRQALEVPYEVLKGDQVVAAGITGGEPLNLPADDYTVRYRWNGEPQTKPVTVAPESLTELALP